MKLGIGRIDSFVHAELIQISAIRRVQSTAAEILCLGVVIGNAFTTEIVVSALNATRNDLCAAVVAGVMVRSTFVDIRGRGRRRMESGDGKMRGDQQQKCTSAEHSNTILGSTYMRDCKTKHVADAYANAIRRFSTRM